MGPNQTKFISMGPIWNTSGTETVISVPVSVLGPERAGTEMGCIHQLEYYPHYILKYCLEGMFRLNTNNVFLFCQISTRGLLSFPAVASGAVQISQA